MSILIKVGRIYDMGLKSNLSIAFKYSEAILIGEFGYYHCNKRITDSRIVTKRSGHFVPIALIGLGKLLHRLCAFDFFKGNIALQNSLHDLPFFQSYMQRLAKAWYRKGRRMLCKYQTP